MSTYTRMGTIAATVIVSLEPDRSGNFVCDGTADDVEINAASAYVNALGGGEIYFTVGIFDITSTLDIYERQHLCGVGLNATRFKLGYDGNMFEYAGTDELIFWTLEHMTLNGDKATRTAGNAIRIVPTGAGKLWDVTIRDVFILNFEDSGITSSDCWGWILDHVIVEYSGAYGVNFTGGNEGVILGGKYNYNVNTQVRLTGLSSFAVIGASIDGGEGIGISLEAADYVLILGCFIYDNAWDGIDINSTSDRARIIGNSITGNNKGIDCHGVDCIIDDNQVWGNTASQITDDGTHNRINGLGREASGGAAPVAANWNIGDIVQDTDNPANHWIKDYDGVMRAIA